MILLVIHIIHHPLSFRFNKQWVALFFCEIYVPCFVPCIWCNRDSSKRHHGNKSVSKVKLWDSLRINTICCSIIICINWYYNSISGSTYLKSVSLVTESLKFRKNRVWNHRKKCYFWNSDRTRFNTQDHHLFALLSFMRSLSFLICKDKIIFISYGY